MSQARKYALLQNVAKRWKNNSSESFVTIAKEVEYQLESSSNKKEAIINCRLAISDLKITAQQFLSALRSA